MGRAGRITMLELALLAGIVAAGWFAFVPDVRRVRNGVLVDRTAIELERCANAIRRLEKLGTNRTDVTLAMIDAWLVSEEGGGEPPLVWPEGARPDTFALEGTNGVSMLVFTNDVHALRSGGGGLLRVTDGDAAALAETDD